MNLSRGERKCNFLAFTALYDVVSACSQGVSCLVLKIETSVSVALENQTWTTNLDDFELVLRS